MENFFKSYKVEALVVAGIAAFMTVLSVSIVRDINERNKIVRAKDALESELEQLYRKQLSAEQMVQEWSNLESRYPSRRLPRVPSISGLPSQEQDQIVKQAALESRLAIIEDRVNKAENNGLSWWIGIKGLLIWIAGTFFSPVVSHFGRRTFNIT